MTPSQIKTFRTSYRIPIVQVAFESGYNVSTLVAYEKGECELPQETVELMCRIVREAERIDLQTTLELIQVWFWED